MERGHVLDVLRQVKLAIRDKDVIKLKGLSNETIHSASVTQDETSIALAVIIYSLSKVLERTNYQKYSNWKKSLSIFNFHLDKAISFLVKNNEREFFYELQNIRKDVSRLTGNLRRHIEDVFRKASINKASRIYEHGISLEKTSKLLGISLFELAEYTGNTGISNVNLNTTMPVKERIKLAEKMFEK